MTMQSTRLLAQSTIAHGTAAFHFAKPAGFDFKPGQAADVVLPQPGADANTPELRHAFSIVSAPYQDELVFATRMRDSAFKRALGALPVGAEVLLDGPFGSLTLHKKRSRAAVFVAGGIGITPFMSMLRQAAKDQLAQDLCLIYSNNRPEDAAFMAELEQLEASNPRFRLIATMTAMERSAQPWQGHTGAIDTALIQQAIQTLDDPIAYVAGPPGMVEAMVDVLTNAGIDEDDVRSEAFAGY